MSYGGSSHTLPQMALPPMPAYPTPFPSDMGGWGPLAFMALKQTGILPPNILNMQWTPTMDVFTQMESMRLYEGQMQAMRMATQADVATMMRYQERFARATGADWAAMKPRAQNFANFMGSALPFMAMAMPEAVDAMMGPRGSSIAMAQQMANFGRFYADPSSGRTGMRPEEVARFSSGIFQELYGTDEATARMRGFGGARAGMIANNMLARGMLDAPAMAPLQEMAAIGGIGGFAAGKALDQGRIKQAADQIRNMTQMLSAVSDFFGANGQPNAPMAQLMQAIDQLGQGSMYRYGASATGNMFRNLQQATITGRISAPEIMQMTSRNAALLNSVGADPSNAIAMTQRSVNFATAATGMFGGNYFGRMDPRELAMRSAEMEAGGAGSAMGQMASVALFLDASVSGLNQNSEFSQLAKAIKSGQRTFANGRSVYDALQGPNLQQLFTQAGGRASTFASVASQPGVAAEFNAAASPIFRVMQAQEAMNFAGISVSGLMGEAFGISDPVQRAAMGRAFSEDFMAMGGKFLTAGHQDRTRMIEESMVRASQGVVKGDQAARMKAVSGRGAEAMGFMTTSFQEVAGLNINQGIPLLSPAAMEKGEQLSTMNNVRGAIAEALGDIGRYSFSQRIAHIMLNLKDGDDLGEQLAKAAGGVDPETVRKALKSGQLMQKLNALKNAGPGHRQTAALAFQEEMKKFDASMKGAGIDLGKIGLRKDMAIDTVTEVLTTPVLTAVGALIGHKGKLNAADIISNVMQGKSPLGGDKDGAAAGKPQATEIVISGELTIIDESKGKFKGGTKGTVAP